MSEEEVIKRLEDLIDTCNKGIEMHPYDKELFETDKTALETVGVIHHMNEEERKSIKNLKKYIEEDGVYKKTLKYYSDFDKFCYNHCKDIDTVLILVEKLQKSLADEAIKSTEKINKAIKRIKETRLDYVVVGQEVLEILEE